MSEPQKSSVQAVAGAAAAARGAFRFVLGVFAGLLIVPAIAAAVYFAFWLVRPPPPLPGVYVTPGAEISRAGGVRASWKGGGESVRQICRDACDDLVFVSPRVKPVELRDRSGVAVERHGRPWRPAPEFVGGYRP